ncbi:MAG: hypothetical protein V4490_01600 [Pseudomonadota bacterium]
MKVIDAMHFPHIYGGTKATAHQLAADADDVLSDLETVAQEINWSHALMNTAIVATATCLFTQIAARRWGVSFFIGGVAGAATLLTGALLPSYSVVDQD